MEKMEIQFNVLPEDEIEILIFNKHKHSRRVHFKHWAGRYVIKTDIVVQGAQLTRAKAKRSMHFTVKCAGNSSATIRYCLIGSVLKHHLSAKYLFNRQHLWTLNPV